MIGYQRTSTVDLPTTEGTIRRLLFLFLYFEISEKVADQIFGLNRVQFENDQILSTSSVKFCPPPLLLSMATERPNLAFKERDGFFDG